MMDGTLTFRKVIDAPDRLRDDRRDRRGGEPDGAGLQPARRRPARCTRSVRSLSGQCSLAYKNQGSETAYNIKMLCAGRVSASMTVPSKVRYKGTVRISRGLDGGRSMRDLPHREPLAWSGSNSSSLGCHGRPEKLTARLSWLRCVFGGACQILRPVRGGVFDKLPALRLGQSAILPVLRRMRPEPPRPGGCARASRKPPPPRAGAES